MYKRLLGIFFCGLVIKLMDDYLDQDLDLLIEDWNFTLLLRRGILPYSLVLMSLACYFNFNETFGYFSASYLMGMAYEGNEKLPTNLLAWQEGLLIIIIGILMTSLQNILGCLLLIILLQMVDDLMDYQKEQYFNQKNFVIILGKNNVILIILIILQAVLLYYPVKLFFFTIATIMVYGIICLFRAGYRNDCQC